MILDDIVAKRREQLEREKEKLSLEAIREDLARHPLTEPFRLSKSLLSRDFALIAEVKKASPSKGVLQENFLPLPTAVAYEKAGAAAISVLTEEAYFQGRNAYVLEIAGSVKIPILRKDFVIDPYQIWHSRYLGASAILLIVAILTPEELRDDLDLADSLGLDAIVEVHTGEELEVALEAGARIIGINNRNLKTFEVDLAVTEELAGRIPSDRIVISESGIRNREDIERVRKAGARAVLVGETLMRSSDIRQAIGDLGL